MDQKRTELAKQLILAVPGFTLLTAVMYASGREFDFEYWKECGLPLMASQHEFADTVYEGFLGFTSLLASFIGNAVAPAGVVLCVAFVGGFAPWALKLLERRVSAAIDARKARKAKSVVTPAETTQVSIRDPDGIASAIERSADIGHIVGLGTFGALGVLLAPALLMLFIGAQGKYQAKASREHKIVQLDAVRKGSKGITVVKVRIPDSTSLAVAIPIGCQGERCAALAEDGPISLLKTDFIQESLTSGISASAGRSPAAISSPAEREGAQAPRKSAAIGG